MALFKQFIGKLFPIAACAVFDQNFSGVFWDAVNIADIELLVDESRILFGRLESLVDLVDD